MAIVVQDIQSSSGFGGESHSDTVTPAGNYRVVVAVLVILRTGALTNTAITLGGNSADWSNETRVDAGNDYVTNISVFINPSTSELTANASWTGVASSTYSRFALVALSGVDQSNPVAASDETDGGTTYTNVVETSVAIGGASFSAGALGADQTLIVGDADGKIWYTDPSEAADGNVTATHSGSAEQSVLIARRVSFGSSQVIIF